MEKSSVVFFHGYEKKPYAGPLRPFVNWSETLIKKHSRVDPVLILFKSDPKIIEDLTPKLREKIMLMNNNNELLRTIRDLSPDVLISDDYYPRLKIFEKIKRNIRAVKTVVYVQFLYGVHSISNCFCYDQISFKEKFLYKVSTLFPYKLLALRYLKAMRVHDFFVSNSKTSKDLLYWLYKIHVEDVVYPPVNTEIFKPSGSDVEDSILVYLGSSGGDIDLNFLSKIIRAIIKRNFKVCLFGNEKTGKIMKKTFNKNVEFYKDLTDAELAELYSKQLATVCPQTWELFGYTAVESMACGTPVLAFNYFGHSETIVNGKTGMLANTESEFINNLKLLLEGSVEFDRGYIRKYAVETFSAKGSTGKLVKIIEKACSYE